MERGRRREDDAVTRGSLCPASSLRTTHQLFKLGRYSEAAEALATLAGQVEDAELDAELMTNVYAAFVACGRGREALERFAVDEVRKMEDGYETMLVDWFISCVCVYVYAAASLFSFYRVHSTTHPARARAGDDGGVL